MMPHRFVRSSEAMKVLRCESLSALSPLLLPVQAPTTLVSRYVLVLVVVFTRKVMAWLVVE